MNKKAKEVAMEKEWQEAVEKAVYVANTTDLKTEIGKKTLVIISTDAALYERLLQKMPKETISGGSKFLGKLLVGLGAAISILSFGLFSFIGVPMAAAGAALGVAGIALDDYKDYSLFIDYDAKTVMFLKTKGDPKLQLPSGINPKKLIK